MAMALMKSKNTYKMPSTSKKLLSKSKYLIGLQCPRYLWTAIHNKEQIPEPEESTELKFEQGYLVQEYAHQWFPDGINIDTEDFNKNLEQSKELLKKRKPLFEPAFKVELKEGHIYSRADVLVPVGKAWDIIEIKSSTKLKPENIRDISFQKYVYEQAGLKIRKCFLMSVNGDYIKEGKTDSKKLMKVEEVTDKVDKEIIGIEQRIKNLFKIINAKKYPEVSIGYHCKKPYECPLTSCWDFIPSENVFELYYGGKKSFELFEKDIKLLKDVPTEFKLTREQQKIQIECAKTGKPHINKEKIKEFLDKLVYPLYYLDFETISTAVPVFNGSHPYQQIPFQYSLHVVEKKGAEPKHISFLAKGDDDPRHEFIKSLKENLGDKGSIVVYNESFEKSVFKKLEMIYPKENKWIELILERIIDLLIPFRNFDYYNPKQNGSASIKKVLPALVGKIDGKKDYKEMEIGKGDVASLAFLKIALGNQRDYSNWKKVSKEEQEIVRNLLEEYCELDTLAEVKMVEELEKLLKAKIFNKIGDVKIK